ncbi:MAG: hydroxymethylglutaryl-CoA lyase [Bdellovibrionales bacterium]
MKKIEVVEVGLRDGLQNETVMLSVDQRFEILKHLLESGIRRIEVGAFVRSDRVPQMSGTVELLDRALRLRKDNRKFKEAIFTVLIPNQKGWDSAGDVLPDEVALFASASETFSQKNINCSIDESFERFEPVFSLARNKKKKIRGYLSVCFGCPFEGPVDEKKVISLIGRFYKLKVDEISIGDTIGVAHAKQIKSLFSKLKSKYGLKKIAGHFHDTRGQALTNILAAHDLGVRIFDSSIGGLGGCPYAPGATGNVATEDLVYMTQGLTTAPGISTEKLIQLSQKIELMMSKSLPSKVSRAGLLKV